MVASSLCDENEPVSFDEAQNSENWMAAIQSKYDVIMKTGTWSLCNLPPSKKAIGTKWVYKLKLNLMEQLIGIRVGLLRKVMPKINALILMRPLPPPVV